MGRIINSLKVSKGLRACMVSFVKYQIVTKLIFSVLIIPIFWGITGFLMSSRGFDAISNSVMLGFLMSPQGLLFLSMVMTVVMLGLIMEVFGYISISSRSQFNMDECSYWELLKYNIKYLPKLFSKGGLILALYLIVFVPLTGAGITLSFLNGIKVPNFITGVIFNNDLYLGLYVAAIAILTFLAMRWVFTFHFILIGDMPVGKSMESSGIIISKNLKTFIVYIIKFPLLVVAIMAIAIVIWSIFVSSIVSLLGIASSAGRIAAIIMLILQNIAIALVSILLIPLEIYRLTKLFYRLTSSDSEFSYLKDRFPVIPPKTKDSLFDRILSKKKTILAVGGAIILLFAVPTGVFFQDIFTNSRLIQVVAHRGGGNLAAENTLKGIEEAVKLRADWTEIDVQRLSDGVYVLNHDNNFKRLTGSSDKSFELTLDEVRQLKVRDLFDESRESQPVSTLEEVMEYSKDKIGLFIELKGATADSKMADDVAKMIRDRKMENQAVLLSLDYELIGYIADNHKDIKTGFLYFLAFGDIGKLKGDYLVMEEDAATELNIDKVHQSGKKAVVWTVNNDESMDKFIDSDVDAIITDYVGSLKEKMDMFYNRTDEDILIKLFLKN